MTVGIGIMQGRLLPPMNGRIQAFPKDRWQEEFPIARDLGFDAIEFVFDMEGADIFGHPLLQRDCREILTLVERYGVRVRTICGDYFMRHPFHSRDLQEAGTGLELLAELIGNSRVLDIMDVVIPCVDQSRLRDAGDCLRLVQRLKPIVASCEDAGVNLALETDLNPKGFKDLLDDFGSARVTVNYDVGNSASEGYDPCEEWNVYGERISSVHIKDRLLRGPTVPLGTGAARFEEFFRAAKASDYQGLFVIQGARGVDDVATAASYKAFVERYLNQFDGD